MSPHDQIISQQSGATIVLLSPGDLIHKSGRRVFPREEQAMKLVKKYTNVPVPNPIAAEYRDGHGQIYMTRVPGITLENCWHTLDDQAKEQLCNQLWEMIEQIRQIPKPQHLLGNFLCYTDGSVCTDVLIQNRDDPPSLFVDNDSVRQRICQCYYRFFGRKYTSDELYAMLPDSDQSVFTHADLAPRNIMVDASTFAITGLLDWECAGWYPDYWEYANIWRGSRDDTYDWQKWMDATNPQKWRKDDLRGIKAARRVLI